MQKLDEQLKQILVQRGDGSTWLAELRADGLYAVQKLTDPNGEPVEQEPLAEPEPMGATGEPEEAEAQGEPATGQPHEQDTSEVLEDMFGGTAPEPNEAFTKMMEELPDRNGMPEHVKDVVKDPAFRARLSSIMLDNKYDRRLRGRTRGKLDMGRLHKVPLMSRSIFTQKQSRKGKAYNVLLLVDESGSMSGEKAVKAAEATLFLLSQLDGLNINTAVVGFNGVIMVQKPWGATSNYDEVYNSVRFLGREGVHQQVSDTGENNDYDAMHFGYEYFKKADDGENIMIMLSDGQPTQDARTTNAYDEKGKHAPKYKSIKHLQTREKRDREHLHHLANSYKDVHSIGVGIMQGGWQIPEHFVIQDTNQLKPTIIKVLGKKIKRG